MRKFTDVVQGSNGVALAGATVTVKLAGTATLATIYASDAGSAYLPVAGVNPIAGSQVTTDSNGRYSFYAADGRYDLTVSGTGITPTTVLDVGSGNDEFYKKITSVGTGLQIPSTIIVEQDAYSGGVNEYPTGAATKTQFQPIRFNLIGRTIGERKGIEGFVQSYGKGDNIGIMASTNDFGGYSTGGDEGSEGGRFASVQGDGTATGGVPVGTVSAVSTNLVTGTWTSSTNGSLGEQRPLINTSRGVYSTGTISSVTGTTPCTVTGAGTGWTALGTGAKTDLFLNITGNNNSTVKHVVPITSITDDTHLVLEYNIAELGATGFGSTLVTSGAYNIYKGGMVASLGVAGTDGNATAVNLASGGSNFQVGDSIQQPLGYNYHGTGMAAIVSRLVGEPNGAGIAVTNTGTLPYGVGCRIIGNWGKGISIDSGTLTADAIFINSVVPGALLRSSDISASTQNVIRCLSSGSAVRDITYDRTNDVWNVGNGFHVQGADTRISTNSLPQSSIQFYLGYNNANWHGLLVAPLAAPSAGFFQLGAYSSDGINRFGVDIGNNRTIINNGMDLKGYSDNLVTNKWSIAGSTGVGVFKGVTDASNAAAGNVGEILSAQNYLVATGLTTATITNITSIALTAGDWDVSGFTEFQGSAATFTKFEMGLSTVNNVLSAAADGSYTMLQFTTGASSDNYLQTGPYRVSINTPTTYYLNVRGTFAAGTLQAGSSIRARRVR